MSNIRKLSAFRQLSLNCNSPTAEQRRKTLKKQFSEDLPDRKSNWLDPGVGIKISLNAKSSRNLDRPPAIKIAWEEPPSELRAEDVVIIKKCKEVRRASTGKLSRQGSLEKDSILHSKQELAERLRQNAKEKEQENANKKEQQEKTNLKIFLAHNPMEHKDAFYNPQREEKTHGGPKLIQPLITNDASNPKKLFQIRRSKSKINLNEIAYSPTTTRSDLNTNILRRDTVVVVPLVETEPRDLETVDSPTINPNDVLKPIDSVIIRPSTAASRREKFQNRTNSAFNATIKEPSHPRPTLTRSSSAPTNSKSKFVATKRKIKSAKRTQLKNALLGDASETNVSNKENPKSQKELNRTTAVNGSDVVTMVSLVSPAGSEGEEEMAEEPKEKSISKNNSHSSKSKVAKEEKDVPKVVPMRKIVKTGKGKL